MNRRRTLGVFGAAIGGLTLAVCLGAVSLANPSQKSETGSITLDSGEVLIVLPPVYHRNLAIYPVRLVSKGAPERYITLDEGLKTGTIEVREAGANPPPLVRPRPPAQGRALTPQIQQSAPPQRGQVAGGQVNRLILFNHSDRKLLLIAGEMVVGGKQDRIIQKDAIIPPNDKPYDLEVFCVEHGRWSGTDPKFRAAALPGGAGGGLGGGIADPSVRGAAQGRAEQQAVWDEVGKKNSALGAAGNTTYQAARSSTTNISELKDYAQHFEKLVPRKGVVGVVIAVNGQLIWVDVFESSALFDAYWPKLLQSYILEAATSRPRPQSPPPKVWHTPKVSEATAYLDDRSGHARFEGLEDVYKLTRVESPRHIIYELSDIERKSTPVVHFCKMEKK